MKRALVAVLAWMCVSATSAAQLRPTGPEFRIADSSNVTVIDVSLSAARNLVLLWVELDQLWIRRFDPQGRPADAPVLVDVADGYILGGAVTAAAQGHFVVTWCRNSGGWNTSHYRVYAASGQPLGEGDLGEGEFCPAFTAAADGQGRFVLTWMRGTGVFAQVIDRKGSVRVPRFRVNPGDVWWPMPASATADAQGRLTLFWSGVVAPGTQCYWGRRFSADGVPIGAPFPVEGVWDASSDADGNVMVVWVEHAFPQATVFARRYGPAGEPLTPVLQVSTDAYASNPRVACDGAGNCVVTFAGRVGDDFYVRARRYRRDGTPDGPEFRVNETAHWCSSGESRLAGNGQGDIAVVFACGVGSDWSNYARLYRVPLKGDFDGDLKADIALRALDDGRVRLWEMVEGSLSSDVELWPISPEARWTVSGVDDFDGDRRQDLALHNATTGELRFWRLAGVAGNKVIGEAGLRDAPTPGPEWELAATGDFNLDGWADLLWQQRVTRQLVVWTLDDLRATGALTPIPDRPEDPNWSVVAAADWNGDGTRDLLWYDAASGQLVQWLLDGWLSRTSSRFVNPASAGNADWRPVAAGDYGVGPGGVIGTHDILWRNQASGRQAIWFLDFDGNRTAGVFTDPPAPVDPLTWFVVGPR